MKVFIVTEGEYSDYHIEGVFSTKEKAKQAKEVFASENNITEWVIDNVPDCPPEVLPWQVYMNKEGVCRSVFRVSASGFKPTLAPCTAMNIHLKCLPEMKNMQ